LRKEVDGGLRLAWLLAVYVQKGSFGVEDNLRVAPGGLLL
jgi:hypothetical protein